MERGLNAWSELTLSDLFFAYRKAKADCFFETSCRVTERFVDFEKDVHPRLAEMLERLQRGEVGAVLGENPGSAHVFPKAMKVVSGSPADQHSFFSDPAREFQRIRSTSDLRASFRIVGDFPVEIHILSALWINLVGHKFDAKLSDHALGSRLRRYQTGSPAQRARSYHREGIGSFEPYYEPYKRWRDEGIQRIREELEKGEGVVGLTLDFSNFYHCIDPSFMSERQFLEEIGLGLNEFERSFTSTVVEYLLEWSRTCRDKILSHQPEERIVGGLPIGISAVRIISNMVLHKIDKDILSSLAPIYFARYVDDIFLVLRDNQEFSSQADVWRHIQRLSPLFEGDPNKRMTIKLPEYFGGTELFFQPEKQKCFFLSGQTGLNLLSNIASQIKEVASERRLMPLPEHLDKGAAARALSTVSSSPDEADSLRRADGLTLRRLGWSILLRSVEVLARDLDPDEWLSERNKFYKFAFDHVVRPDKILEQLDHLPRLMALAISLADWGQAKRLFDCTLRAIAELQSATELGSFEINGLLCHAGAETLWDELEERTKYSFRDAILRAFPINQGSTRSRAALALLGSVGLSPKACAHIALAVREADLGRQPYKEHLRWEATRYRPITDGEDILQGEYRYIDDLRRFLARSSIPAIAGGASRLSPQLTGTEQGESPESLLPYLFPTRPYSAREIALYCAEECVFGEPINAAHHWARYVRAVRGVWVRSDLADEFMPLVESTSDAIPPIPPPSGSDNPPVRVGASERSASIRLGITSFGVSQETWACGANGSPDHSKTRYRALANIINDAIRQEHRPDYLLLPELSVPARWLDTISGRLIEARISLIAGLDYRLHPNNKIDSVAVLALLDDRLGFTTSLEIRQAKTEPAPGEDEELSRNFGRSWVDYGKAPKPIYDHFGFQFGVLVCSELQNLQHRLDFQGKVDCLVILSWNRDLETFSALVDAAGLDVHAYIALVNNRAYGDSRVRRPSKKSYERDICRIRGGLNDQLVIVEINPSRLRAQQSRVKR